VDSRIPLPRVSAWPAEPAWREEEATRREVRKMVTVVFSDVASSTALGERLDPESLRRAMGRYSTR
jgi:class 3 adenylate cyclase